MKQQSRTINIITRIINIRKWFDWDRVKSYTLYLGNGVNRLFIPEKNAKTEVFDEEVKKLSISEESLLAKQKSLFRLSMIMLVAAILIFSYAGYQLFYGSIKGFLISLIVTLVALVLAFRYHFWYFQIKHRKLGCTFDEWFKQGLLGEKK